MPWFIVGAIIVFAFALIARHLSPSNPLAPYSGGCGGSLIGAIFFVIAVLAIAYAWNFM